MADFFTSSWNLNHFNMINYYNRPFQNVDEMNECIIENTNKIVKENDRLIFAGDFLFGPLSDEKFLRTCKYFRRKIICNNIFLTYGNHDRRARKMPAFRKLFTNVSDYLETKSHNNQSLVIFHYPIEIRAWNRVKDNAWHLHGLSDIPIRPGPRMDISVDRVWEVYYKDEGPKPEYYRPFTFAEVENYINEMLAWEQEEKDASEASKGTKV